MPCGAAHGYRAADQEVDDWEKLSHDFLSPLGAMSGSTLPWTVENMMAEK